MSQENEVQKLKDMYKNLNYSLDEVSGKNPILRKLFNKYKNPKGKRKEEEEVYLPLFL